MGCGIGRMALPLTGYLSKEAEYVGFDIVPKGIEWCTKNISSKFPNYHFELLDIFNKYYNPNGKLPGSSFAFPYADNYFDFVYATSLFTHLMPEDAVNYLKEAHRVLKPGGRLAISDVVAATELPESMRSDPFLLSACVGGAETIEKLEAIMQEAGFSMINLQPKDESSEFIREWVPGKKVEDFVLSATIEAKKQI